MRFYQHGMTLLKDLRATLFRRTADSPARFFDHGGLGRERCLLCIEEFTLGREPVLFGLSIWAAICSPNLISALTNTLRHGLIHWGTSFRLIRVLGITDYWLTKHYGGLVCDIQGWFRRGMSLRRNQAVCNNGTLASRWRSLKTKLLAIFFQPSSAR